MSRDTKISILLGESSYSYSNDSSECLIVSKIHWLWICIHGYDENIEDAKCCIHWTKYCIVYIVHENEVVQGIIVNRLHCIYVHSVV